MDQTGAYPGLGDKGIDTGALSEQDDAVQEVAR
jgi:hypothetical protein